MPISPDEARAEGADMGFDGDDLAAYVLSRSGATPAPKPAAPKPPPPMKMTASAKAAAPMAPKVEAKPIATPPAKAPPGMVMEEQVVVGPPQKPSAPPPMYGPVAAPAYNPPKMTAATGPGALPDPWNRGWSPEEAEQWRARRAATYPAGVSPEENKAARLAKYGPTPVEEVVGNIRPGWNAAVDQFKRPERRFPGDRPPLSPGAEILHSVRGVTPPTAPPAVAPDATATPATPRPVHNPRPAPGYKPPQQTAPVAPAPTAAAAVAPADPEMEAAIDALITVGGIKETTLRMAQQTPEGRAKIMANYRKIQARGAAQ